MIHYIAIWFHNILVNIETSNVSLFRKAPCRQHKQHTRYLHAPMQHESQLLLASEFQIIIIKTTFH